MAIRSRQWGALLALLFMTSCGAPNENAAAGGPSVSSASQPAPTGGAVPFPEFHAAVENARYSDYAGKPGTKVRDEQAFDEMRRYLLDRYDSVAVSRSYLLGGATFDCVGNPSQPPTDANCPPGTVPMRRVALTELVRFETLRSFLGKGPGGGGLPPVPPSTR